MPRKRLAPTDPKEWLRRARSNLALAKNRVAEACLEDLCFDSQQARKRPSRRCSFTENWPSLLLMILPVS